MNQPINVIYFITHDSGRYFGCYNRPMPSPNIDRFAASGIRFNQSYCSSPACAPSRCCAMTGLHANQHGNLSTMRGGWDLPPEQLTIVDYLNEAGYETFHAGFCHERSYGTMRYEHDGSSNDERLWKDRSDLVVNNAIQFLREERDPSRPFYMNLATLETHVASININGEAHGRDPAPEDSHIPPTLPEDAFTRKWWQRHAASVRFVDEQFGRLVAAIDELGLADDTLIIFTTDHGIWQNRAKGQVTAEGTEVALLLRPPTRLGIPSGQQRDELIPNIDYLPTILEACGAPIPKNIDGRSFWPLVTGEDYTPHQHIFIERNWHGEQVDEYQIKHDDLWDPMRCVRTNNYSYIRHCEPEVRKRQPYHWEIKGWTCDPGKTAGRSVLPKPTESRAKFEFYDIQRDPMETIDLSGRAEYQNIIKELSAKLDAWQEHTQDFPYIRFVPTNAIEARQKNAYSSVIKSK